MTANREAFLAGYRKFGNVAKAAAAARISRRLHYKWVTEDPVYRAAFDVADAEFRRKWAASAESTEGGLRADIKNLEDRIMRMRREFRAQIRALEAKIDGAPQKRSRQPQAEGDALLDQIARGMAKQSFSKLSSAHQNAVRDIAARIKSSPD